MKGSKTCCFSTYYDAQVPFIGCMNRKREKKVEIILRQNIRRLIETENVRHFITGVLPGLDMLAAESVLALREKYPDITLECAIASEELANNWSEELRDKYFRIVEHSDRETMLAGTFSEDSIRLKNAYLILKSDYVITDVDDEKGFYIYTAPILL